MKLLTFSLILFCLFTTGCQNKTPPTPTTKELRLSLKSEPSTLDPRKGGDIISSQMQFLLFEGLVRLHADHSITPAQAQSFECSKNGLIYTFKLRETFWSNGLPVTAYDFEKSWKDILDPSFPSVNAHLLYPIKNAEGAKKGILPLNTVGIRAPDDKTLIVTLEKPTPYFLELLSFCVFFPVCSALDKQDPTWAYHADEQFVSNGPFLLKKWKHNDELVVTQNPSYWDGEKTRPEKIHFSVIENEMTALQLFEQGELDMIGDPIGSLPIEALPYLKQKWQVHKFPIGGTTIISFNVDREPFNNVKIRKALSYAINREAIVTNIIQTEETPALCAVPAILKQQGLRCFFKDGDIEVARTLLKEGMEELGITKEAFCNLSYLYSNSDKNHKIAQAIQQQWNEVLGIDIAIENLESKILMDKLSKRDYSLAQSLWAGQYKDPMSILERFQFKTNVKNYPNWENPAYITLLESSSYVKGTARDQILEEAEALLLNEMPICPLYHWDMNYIIQPRCSSFIGELVFNSLSTDKNNTK